MTLEDLKQIPTETWGLMDDREMQELWPAPRSFASFKAIIDGHNEETAPEHERRFVRVYLSAV